MNLIFVTLSDINNISYRGIYTDLMRKFRDKGHQVYIVSAAERRTGVKTMLMNVDGAYILKVHALNIQKANIMEKGVGTLFLGNQYVRAIKKYLTDVHFELILYSTPPITLTNVVEYLKKESPSHQLFATEGYLSAECCGYWVVWKTFAFQLVVSKERSCPL